MTRRLLILVTLLLLSLSPCPAQDQQELVLNGGFEIPSLDGTSPDAWFATRLQGTSEFVEFTWSSDVKRSGDRSAQIAISSQHPEQRIAYNWGQLIQGFTAGKKYKIVAFIKTEDVSIPPLVVIQCWDEGFKNIIGFATTEGRFDLTGTLDWTKVKVKFKVPVETAAIVIRAVLTTPENRGGKVWFDDISVSPK